MGRDVRRAVASRFVTNAGAEAGFFIGMWGKAAFELDGGPFALAMMTAMIAVTSVLGNVIGGVMVDRLDARRVLVATEVLLVPAVLALVVADSLTALFTIAAVPFLLHGIEETAATSLPPALLEPDDEAGLVRANARLEGAGWLAMVVGPGIGGVLAAAFGIDTVFLFDAATSVVSIGLLLGIRLASHPDVATDGTAGDGNGGGLAATLAGLSIARRTPQVMIAMAIGSLMWFGFGAFVALEPLYYRDVLHQGPEAIGYVNAVFGVGLFAGSSLVDRVGGRFGYVATVWLSAAGAVGAVVYVGSASMVVVVVGAVLWSIPIGMAFPILRTLAQRAAPAGSMGRVMGAVAMAQNTTSVLPALLVPFLATAIGVQTTLVLAGMIPMLGVPLLLGRARRLDEQLQALPPVAVLPTPHPERPTPLP